MRVIRNSGYNGYVSYARPRLWPDKTGWGGIADRLRGARGLVMDDRRAVWRSWGVAEQFNRGSYPDMLALWEGSPSRPVR